MKSFIGGKVFSLGMLLVLATFSSSAAEELISCPVTIKWDPSPDASVTGYVLYYGIENSNTTNRLDVGPAQSVSLTNLNAKANYFFFATAYNTLGVESVPSGSLFYRPPAISRLRIARQAKGTIQLQFRSAVGSPCRIEYALTPDSSFWQTLASTNADAAGNVVISDPSAAQDGKRFYRAVRMGAASRFTFDAAAK
jgi:hypothetical protein